MLACTNTTITAHRGHRSPATLRGDGLRSLPPRCRSVAVAAVAGAGEGLASEHLALALIRRAVSGELPPEQAAKEVARMAMGIQQVEDFANVDTFRSDRTGLPEVVWGAGKTPDQVSSIMLSLAQTQQRVIATRITPDVYAAVRKLAPGVEYNARARTLTLRSPVAETLPKPPRLPGTLCVVTAGTADLSVAEECRIVAEHMGCYAYKITDVGVESLHRLLGNLQAIRTADVVVVVSGMDGGLPSVIAGLVESPVIAVPTSVGYGAALGGMAPLLAGLNASSPGVTVVNVDNGFGAAMVATRILRSAARLHKLRTEAAARAAAAQQPAPAPAAAPAAPAAAVRQGGAGESGSNGNGNGAAHGQANGQAWQQLLQQQQQAQQNGKVHAAGGDSDASEDEVEDGSGLNGYTQQGGLPHGGQGRRMAAGAVRHAANN